MTPIPARVPDVDRLVMNTPSQLIHTQRQPKLVENSMGEADSMERIYHS
jgi:hypothetical protein